MAAVTTAKQFPKRMDPLTMQKIARAYNVGADPKEIAADHGITVHAVFAIAKRYEAQKREISRSHTVVARPPSIQTPEPEPIRLTGNTYVVERYDPFAPAGNGRVQRITLPLLTIQARAVK